MNHKNKNYLNELRQDISFREQLAGQTLNYHSTWGIFSPREIDEEIGRAQV